MHLAYSATEVEINNQKRTTQLRKNGENPKWMEEYTIFIDQKAQYYRDGSVPKFDLQTSVQPKQNPCCSVWECVSLVSIDKLILKYIWKKNKIHMEMQSAKHNQDNIEEEQSYRTNITMYQDL